MNKQEQRSRTMAWSMLIVVIGACVFVRGISLAWRPGGWMAAGILIAFPALCAAYGTFREK